MRKLIKRTMTEEEYSDYKKRYLKEWQKKNPEKYLHGLRRKKHVFSTLAKYVNGNSKKVYKRNNTLHLFIHLKPKILFSLAKKQKLKCAISGIKLTSDNMSVDHIKPLSKGGLNDISNLRLVHVDINRIMLDYDDDVFLNFCKTIVNHNNL